MKYLALTILIFSMSLFTFTGCSDDDNGGSGGSGGAYSEQCSVCFNNAPTGPSADAQACTAYGQLYGCQNAVLSNANVCDGDSPATCSVSNCSSEPDQTCGQNPQ